MVPSIHKPFYAATVAFVSAQGLGLALIYDNVY